MTSLARPFAALSVPADLAEGVIRHVLVVDDSRVQRRILSASLSRWGYAVTEADSGESALRAAQTAPVDLVISDWMMPGMSGLAFCRAFRSLPRERYGYFILLTSKSDKSEIARGLDAGADDFLTKPVFAEELRARIVAGERVLRMEREVRSKNGLLADALSKLQSIYDALDRDLIEARKLQQTLVRDPETDYGPASVSLLLRPSGHVGGDLVGHFPISDRRVALYSIDVSGHGVASAFLASRLAGMLSNAGTAQNFAVGLSAHGLREAWPPDLLASRFNRMMFEDLQVDQYFTMAYAEADVRTGRVILVQAGHPHPAVIGSDGQVRPVGDGGMPVGLIRDAVYETVELRLAPGDRLFLMSDGMTETHGPCGELGEEGLRRLIARRAGLDGTKMLEALVSDLAAWQGGAEFADDVSAVLFSYRGGS